MFQLMDSGTFDFLLLQEVNEKVLEFLKNLSSPYQLVRAFNEETGKESELCIAYKTSHKLIATGFKSFSAMRRDPMFGLKHPSFGILWANFNIGTKILRLATLHLHSGVNQEARLQELRLAKTFLSNNQLPTILAGDFNSGFPREPKNMANILAPEFIWISKNLGPTLNSRYSENLPHLPNRIAAFLGIFNVGIGLRTDHIFANAGAANNFEKCLKLPDRVSDHSPVEFIINFPT